MVKLQKREIRFSVAVGLVVAGVSASGQAEARHERDGEERKFRKRLHDCPDVHKEGAALAAPAPRLFNVLHILFKCHSHQRDFLIFRANLRKNRGISQHWPQFQDWDINFRTNTEQSLRTSRTMFARFRPTDSPACETPDALG